MKLNNLQEIKSRLLLIGITILVILIISAALMFRYLGQIGTVEKLDQHLNTFTFQLSELFQSHSKFLLEEPTNLYFYKTGRSTYIENFNQKYKSCTNTLNTLQSLQIKAEYKLKEDFDKLQRQLQTYKAQFNQLTKEIRSRGSSQYGLVNKLNNSYLKLDSLFKQVPDSAVLPPDYLLLREFQQKFTLNAENSYKYRFQEISQKYKQKIQADTVLAPALKNRLLVALEGYSLYFNRLINKENQLGSLNGKGLQNRMEDQILAIESTTQGILRKVKARNAEEITSARRAVITTVLILLGLLTLLMVFLYYSIARPLQKMRAYIDEMVLGKIPQVKLHGLNDEIGRMLKALSTFVDGLKEKTAFARKIGEGDYYAGFRPIGKQDQLGNALLEMQNNLQKAREEEQKHREKDQKNEWINNSLNDFNNLIKQTNIGIEALSYKLIAKLVDHLGANQGGMFLHNNEENPPVLDLVASYAYGKEKKQKYRVMLQEGLVGSCAVERKTIYLDEIPEDYSKIASGLGGYKPQYLLIVPLLNGEELLGVLEIASFYPIEAHHIEFIKRFSENIASTFSNIQINEQTQQLLDKTRKQSEELSGQEEEMRQNLEELQATQEESTKREAELSSIVQAVSASLLYTEFDMEGTITHVNDAFLRAFELDRPDVLGKTQLQLEKPEAEEQEAIKQLWEELKTGTTQKREEKITIDDRTAWLSRTYAPVVDENNNPVKVISLAINNTETNRQYEELKSQNEQLEAQEEEMRQNMEQLFNTNSELEEAKQEEIKAREETIEQMEQSKALLNNMLHYMPARIHLKDNQGKILFANHLFAEALDFTRQSLAGKTVHDIYAPEKAKRIEDEEQIIMRSSAKTYVQEEIDEDQKYFLQTTKFPFQLPHKNKVGILTISQDVSAFKALEQQAKEQKEMISAQEAELRENFKELDRLNKNLTEEKANLQAVIEALDATLCRAVFDHEGRVEEVNRKFAENSQLTAKEMEGKHFKESFSRANKETVDKIWRDITKGKTHRDEITFTDEQGRQTWVAASFIPIIDNQGFITKYYYFSNDITKLKTTEQQGTDKSAEAKLRQLEEQKSKADKKQKDLEQFVKGLDQSLPHCELHANLRIRSSNNLFRNLLGYTGKALQGKAFTTLIGDEQQRKDFENRMKEQKRFSMSLSLKTKKGGQTVQVSAAVVPFTDDKQNLTFISLFAIVQ